MCDGKALSWAETCFYFMKLSPLRIFGREWKRPLVSSCKTGMSPPLWVIRIGEPCFAHICHACWPCLYHSNVDCWAQHHSTCVCVFTTFKCRFFLQKRDKKSSEKLPCVLPLVLFLLALLGLCFSGSVPSREALDVRCLPPIWNLRAVIWFPFPISSHFSA